MLYLGNYMAIRLRFLFALISRPMLRCTFMRQIRRCCVRNVDGFQKDGVRILNVCSSLLCMSVYILYADFWRSAMLVDTHPPIFGDVPVTKVPPGK